LGKKREKNPPKKKQGFEAQEREREREREREKRIRV
jgi:hypothetical protein